jgi:hypothetical protein
MEAIPRPFEVDAAEYPFADHWLPYGDGLVHYVDEGQGPPVLLLHGNPTWSYVYRHVIKGLRAECRLVAPDYPGFGMSKAPSRYGFTPQEHSQVIAELIRHLALTNFVLVVQDWGGPDRDELRGPEPEQPPRHGGHEHLGMARFIPPMAVLGRDGRVAGRVLASDPEEFLCEIHAPERDHSFRARDRRVPNGVHGSLPHRTVEDPDMDLSPPDP